MMMRKKGKRGCALKINLENVKKPQHKSKKIKIIHDGKSSLIIYSHLTCSSQLLIRFLLYCTYEHEASTELKS